MGCLTALQGLVFPRVSRASARADSNTGRETDRCHHTDTNVFTAATVTCTNGSWVQLALNSNEKPKDDPGCSEPVLRAAATLRVLRAELLTPRMGAPQQALASGPARNTRAASLPLPSFRSLPAADRAADALEAWMGILRRCPSRASPPKSRWQSDSKLTSSGHSGSSRSLSKRALSETMKQVFPWLSGSSSCCNIPKTRLTAAQAGPQL